MKLNLLLPRFGMLCLLFLIPILTNAQNVAINATGATADASAMLDITSTSSGVLIPRMTQAQRNGITTPATGLMIYQTDNTPGFYYYTGSAWTGIGGSDTDWTSDANGWYQNTTMVGIGQVPDANDNLAITQTGAGFGLDMNGNGRVQTVGSAQQLTLVTNGVSNEPSIIPSANNWGFLGNSTTRMFDMHITNISYYGTLTNASDRRIKENIRPLSSALQTVHGLKGYTYDLKTDFLSGGSDDPTKIAEAKKSGKDRIGFIAQEVQEVLPNAVRYDEEADLYSVNYIAVVPVLVEAMKEQQAEIETLEAKLNAMEALEQRIARLEAKSDSE